MSTAFGAAPSERSKPMASITVGDLGAAISRGDVKPADVLGGMTTAMTARSLNPFGFDTMRSQLSGGGLSSRALTERGTTTNLGGAPKVTATRANRKKNATPLLRDPDPTVSEKVDATAERIFQRLVENPVWLESCMEYPSVQRVCFPAEYATRNNRGEEGDDAGGTQKGSENVSFGLPDFSRSGYSVLEDIEWTDDDVPTNLGLQLAIHGKSSHKRLLFHKAKSELPHGVTPEQIRSLMRLLRRCDHVNMLACTEVFEDNSGLYLMYEYYPAVTLATVLSRNIPMTQEQCVNVLRECCAATAFAHSMGLFHMGWTLHHVLLPETALDSNMNVAKVFGFGLMGALTRDTTDHLCWAPEGLDKFNQSGDGGNFVPKLESHDRANADSWSLGSISYAVVAKQPPFRTDAELSAKKWAFTLLFDEIDRESKSLIESMLHPIPDKRMRPERTLHHEWIRKRWRPPPGSSDILRKLESFCEAPLAKRLFGRFLAGFLESQHLRFIAEYFYSLDSGGKGVITLKMIQYQTKLAGRPPSVAQKIFDWLKSDGCNYIALQRFAESLAEDVADGPSLRTAFESLDEDGSEEVTAEELWELLTTFDPKITLGEVKSYIESVEQLAAAAKGEAKDDNEAEEEEDENKVEKHTSQDNNDGAMDYEEFLKLFPMRTQRIDAIEKRITEFRETGLGHAKRFQGVRADAVAWVKALEFEQKSIDKLLQATAQRGEESDNAAKTMKKHFTNLMEKLHKIPGQENDGLEAFGDDKGKKKKGKQRKHHSRNDCWNYDNFITHQGHKERWSVLLNGEMRALKSALTSRSKLSEQIDSAKAHDVANIVVEKVIGVVSWSKSQLEEYDAFVEAFESPEVVIGQMPFSSRGLRHHGADDKGPADRDGDGVDDGEGQNGFGAFFRDVTARFA